MIYALIIAVIVSFGSGYGVCWKQQATKIATLEASIVAANTEAKDKLDSITASVVQATASAIAKNNELELNHATVIAENNKLSEQLSNAINTAARLRESNTPANSRCTVPKVSNTPLHKAVNAGGQIIQTNRLSENLDNYLQQTAGKIDKTDIDLHMVLHWLNSIPKDLISE